MPYPGFFLSLFFYLARANINELYVFGDVSQMHLALCSSVMQLGLGV